MNKIKRIIVFALALSLSCLTIGLHAEKKVVVKGGVSSPSGRSLAHVPVALMEIKMGQRPSITVVGESETDKSGSYYFSLPFPAKNVFYRVVSSYQGMDFGSEPFHFKNERAVVIVDLSLPKRYEGIDYLEFKKSTLVLDILEKSIRVTEIINLSNPLNGVVDAKRIPFAKELPESAHNVQLFNREEGMELVARSGKIYFDLMVPPGDHQLFFSYDLTSTDSSLLFETHLPPGTPEVELLTSERGIGFGFDGSGESREIEEKSKRFSRNTYRSKSMRVEPGIDKVKITVDGIPLSQKRLFYPAIVLALALITGLFVFIKRGDGTPSTG